MQDQARIFAKQLSSIPKEVVTVEDLRAAGRWCDLYTISQAIDAAFAACDFTGGDVATAQRVQDYLALHIAIRELPPARPTALRLLSIGGPCSAACDRPGCLGNRLVSKDGGAYSLVFEHHKTRSTRDEAISVAIPAGSTTATLLHDFIGRRRAQLLKTDTYALFIGQNGDAISEAAFSAYVPRLLRNLGLGCISYTAVRQCAAVTSSLT
jgi:hypothetical protein